MNEINMQISGTRVRLISVNTVIVGTGAAGFNAADRLFQYGVKDIAIVTEHILAGTSRNTGSDKQTYYKLSLSGEDADSVVQMAEVLYAGGCVDGEHALCEAALSAQSFYKLAELGVPFPKNRYGEYVGYKTDHDPARRATSAGPYTSRAMTEALQESVKSKDIPIFDKFQMIRILKEKDTCRGILCVSLERTENPYVVFKANHVILCTGGPAGMYSDSVYPNGHYGANGVAFEAGVRGKNLTEWQFGLASVSPRWNVSGTYMQVLPRFVSTDENGNDEREFMEDFFEKQEDMLSKIFFKGYQWPFDVKKIRDGSSIIDILVYLETRKGRKVYLDYRTNPGNRDIDFERLDPEARAYLSNAGACFGTPIDRLVHMNEPAVSFFRDRGIDLAEKPLRIALCAQHNNGGLLVDAWWQTNLTGLYAAGEAAGTHGVTRPGGTALNAGQVGSTRAAQHIAAHPESNGVTLQEFIQTQTGRIEEIIGMGKKAVRGTGTVKELYENNTRRMSACAGAIRDPGAIREFREDIRKQLSGFPGNCTIQSVHELPKLYRFYDTLVCQYVYLCAFTEYAETVGRSRGSALCYDPAGALPCKELGESFRYTLSNGEEYGKVQEILYKDLACSVIWRDVRPIPETDRFFENVWRSFRENGNVE